MSESRYTRIGCELWNWEPWIQLGNSDTGRGRSAQILWLGLYTSSEAKRICPGLWHGGIGTMSDALRMQSDEVLASLDLLIDHRLAEYDQRNRVLRLTMLPDAGERAHNPNALMGWWNRFRTVPSCPTRDAHVRLLQWLQESDVCSDKMQQAWNSTFRGVRLPPEGRMVQKLTDSDTGTTNQPSLFSSPICDSERKQEDLRSVAWMPPSMVPSMPPWMAHGPDQDQVQDQCSGSGSNSSRPPAVSESMAVGENAHRATGMPKLALVPPFTAEAMLEALAGGRRAIVRESSREALHATIHDLDARGVTLAEVAVAGSWLSRQPRTLQNRWPSCHPDELVCVWAAQPGNVVAALEQANAHERQANERSAMLREVMGEA